MRAFFQRLSVIPFEAVIAALVLFSGLIDLTHIGSIAKSTLDVLLPSHVVVALDIMYAVSGACMLWGIGRGRAAPEAFGIALLVASLLLRSIALVAVARWSQVVATVLFFNLVVLLGCLVRLGTLLRRASIIRLAP